MKLKNKIIFTHLQGSRARGGFRGGKVVRVDRSSKGDVKGVTIRLHDGDTFDGPKIRLRPSEIQRAEVMHRGKLTPITD